MQGKRVALYLFLGCILQMLAGTATALIVVKVERLYSVSSESPSGDNDEDATPVLQRVGCIAGNKVPFKKR